MTAEPPRHNYTPKRPSSDVPGYDRAVTQAEPVPADLDALRADVVAFFRDNGTVSRGAMGAVLQRWDILAAELEGARQKVADLQAERDAADDRYEVGYRDGEDAARAEAAALRTALGDAEPIVRDLADPRFVSWGRDGLVRMSGNIINNAHAWVKKYPPGAALAGARPEATEGADDPVRRDNTDG